MTCILHRNDQLQAFVRMPQSVRVAQALVQQGLVLRRTPDYLIDLTVLPIHSVRSLEQFRSFVLVAISWLAGSRELPPG